MFSSVTSSAFVRFTNVFTNDVRNALAEDKLAASTSQPDPEYPVSQEQLAIQSTWFKRHVCNVAPVDTYEKLQRPCPEQSCGHFLLWYWHLPLEHSKYTELHCAVVVQVLPTAELVDPPDEDFVLDMQGSLESPDELLT